MQSKQIFLKLWYLHILKMNKAVIFILINRLKLYFCNIILTRLKINVWQMV